MSTSEEPAREELVAALRTRLGEMLNLEEPVSEAVARLAIEDPLYAHHLMVSRDNLDFLLALLSRPEQGRAGGEAPGALTTNALLARAAKALWRWSKAGFTKLDDATYRARLDACLACPHLVEPPDRLVYRVAATAGAGMDGRVCGKCGCLAARKARLPSESCPDRQPGNPHVTRWGEPIARGAR